MKGSCYLRPERGGYLPGIFEADPLAYDLEASPPYLQTRDVELSLRTTAQAHERLAAIFPILENLGIVEVKRGLTTFVPDGAYLIGPVPESLGEGSRGGGVHGQRFYARP